MTRIKIKDLPKDMKISAEEMRRIHAGASYDFTKFRLSHFAYRQFGLQEYSARTKMP